MRKVAQSDGPAARRLFWACNSKGKNRISRGRQAVEIGAAEIERSFPAADCQLNSEGAAKPYKMAQIPNQAAKQCVQNWLRAFSP